MDKKHKKASGIKEPLEMQKLMLQKILTSTILLLVSTANMLDMSRFLNGCTILQHALVVETI